MARQLRLLVPGANYHVINRGQRQAPIFLDDEDRRRFLGLAAELPERFRLELMSFALMDNHYHLILRTLDPNLSDAIRWLQVSYASRFNWAHQSTGHVFQGRFKAVVLQSEREVAEVARYVHLNPVRLEILGLSKASQRQARVVGVEDPGKELVAQRLKQLRDYPWSSWRVYSGAEPCPDWLETDLIAKGCGGRSKQEQRDALRAYTEAPVRQGHLDSPWERLIGGLVLGEADYAQALLKGRPANAEEQTEVRQFKRTRRKEWKEIIATAEEITERKWAELLERHGDWGRNGTMYVAVRFCGQSLAEIVRAIPGLKYQAAAQGVAHFRKEVETDEARAKFVRKMKSQLSIL